MADNIKVNVSGVIPALTGTDAKFGEWFLIDESGNFSIDTTITATVWIVGGGCDGGNGIWKGNKISPDTKAPIINSSIGDGVSYSGAGGDSGYVYKIGSIEIAKDQILSAVIAEKGDKTGTTFQINGNTYRCNQTGSVFQKGGDGGSLPPPKSGIMWSNESSVVLPTKGTNGMETPYGYVGSSGGGGAACNGRMNADNGIQGGQGAGSGTDHRSNGTNASNYGCGGGGGAFCGNIAYCPTEQDYNELVAAGGVMDDDYILSNPEKSYITYQKKGWYYGGEGKKGCIIISYGGEEDVTPPVITPPVEDTPEENNPIFVVQKHRRKVTNKKNAHKTDYYSNNNIVNCCGNNYCISNASDYTDTIHIGKSK